MSIRGIFADGVNVGGDMGNSPYSSMSATAALMAQPTLLSPPISQPVLNSPSLSLAINPKMEGQRMMSLMGEGFEPNRLRSRMREDEYDNQDAASGDDDQEFAGDKNSKKKKKYNRHTPYQIQELEAFFKVNNHPEEKDRLELGRRLSLDSRQVKFWFQNRRTQLKTQIERHENSLLRRQNEELILENIRMKEVLRNPACTNCGGPAILGDLSVEEQHLRIENSRLRDEINRMSALAERFLGRPVSSLVGPSLSSFDISNSSSLELAMGTNGLIISSASLDTKEMAGASAPPLLPFHPATPPTNNPFEKSIFLDLAEKSMEELVKLVQADDPLWIRSGSRGLETLNLEEYARLGPPCLRIKSEGYSTNATRTSGTVVANSLSIAESLMDGNQWADMFPCIIGKTTIIDIIQRGTTTCTINGALHMMYAELQGLSPLIPVRAVKFLRFCRQLAEGVWGVVDVSVDGSHEVSESHAFFNCMRLPSGCVVQDMANGCSKVTWVEHLEYEENGILHPLLGSGTDSCFGAERWLASLQRQCQCLEILTSPISNEDHHHSGNIIITPSGKRSMINLAHRMTRSFCFGVCSTVHPWQLVQVSNMGEESRLTIRNNSSHNPGEPSGMVLSATTSVWMSVSHQCLFEFLRSEQLRSEWDELAYDRPMQEMARVNKSNDGLNCVSLLRSTVPNSTSQNAMVILQETQTDSSGSVIAYAAVDVQAMQMVMDGGESGSVAILPSGFAIIPNEAKEGSDGGMCLMTVGFQILVNSPANAKLTVESVETVNSLMFRRIQRIKSALGCA